MHGKLKTWKERISFYGQDVTYNMYCNAAVVLKVDSLYTNKIKTTILKYMLKSINTFIQKTSNVIC